MPIMSCNENGKPGVKWGKSGKCYIYNPKVKGSRKRAVEKARAQMRAIKAKEKS